MATFRIGIALLVGCLLPALGFTAESMSGFVGRAEVFSDAADRVWILADRDGDDRPDIAAAFTTRELALPPVVLAELPRSIERAQISFAPKRVTIQERDRRDVIVWQIALLHTGRTPERIERNLVVGAPRLELAEGASLVWFDRLPQHDDGTSLPQPMTFEQAGMWAQGTSTLLGKGAASGDPLEDCPECGSGGKGAGGCSSSCELSGNAGGSGGLFGGQAGVSSSSSCGVSCGEGYFACCGCAVGVTGWWSFAVQLAQANCQCVSNGCTSK
jgi:hypothetical protein